MLKGAYMLVFATPVRACFVGWLVRWGMNLIQVICAFFEFRRCGDGNKFVLSVDMVLWESVAMEIVHWDLIDEWVASCRGSHLSHGRFQCSECNDDGNRVNIWSVFLGPFHRTWVLYLFQLCPIQNSYQIFFYVCTPRQAARSCLSASLPWRWFG